MANDALLVSRAALLGDKDAFGRLVEEYQSPLRRFFYRLTDGDEELSKDLAQDAFVKAWLNIASFRAAAKFSTWLYRIAYNVFQDYLRTHRATDPLDAAENIAVDAPDHDFALDFSVSLRCLKADERTAMLLFYSEDMPVDKIADVMRIPAGTVKSHLARGRDKLTKFFKNSGYDK